MRCQRGVGNEREREGRATHLPPVLGSRLCLVELPLLQVERAAQLARLALRRLGLDLARVLPLPREPLKLTDPRRELVIAHLQLDVRLHVYAWRHRGRRGRRRRGRRRGREGRRATRARDAPRERRRAGTADVRHRRRRSRLQLGEPRLERVGAGMPVPLVRRPLRLEALVVLEAALEPLDLVALQPEVGPDALELGAERALGSLALARRLRLRGDVLGAVQRRELLDVADALFGGVDALEREVALALERRDVLERGERSGISSGRDGRKLGLRARDLALERRDGLVPGAGRGVLRRETPLEGSTLCVEVDEPSVLGTERVLRVSCRRARRLERRRRRAARLLRGDEPRLERPDVIVPRRLHLVAPRARLSDRRAQLVSLLPQGVELALQARDARLEVGDACAEGLGGRCVVRELGAERGEVGGGRGGRGGEVG